VPPQPDRSLKAAHPVVTDHHDRTVAGNAVKAVGERGHRDAETAVERTDLRLPRLADIEHARHRTRSAQVVEGLNVDLDWVCHRSRQNTNPRSRAKPGRIDVAASKATRDESTPSTRV